MKDGVLEIMIVCRDKCCKEGSEDEERGRGKCRFAVREYSIEHYTSRIYHRQLVEELHRIYQTSVFLSIAIRVMVMTFKCSMETKAPKADKKIADEADEKHGVVFVANRTGNSLVG